MVDVSTVRIIPDRDDRIGTETWLQAGRQTLTNRGGQDDVQRVRDATDLVGLVGEHVALRQRGREYIGLCPFHDDSNPSFAVVVHKGNPFFKCHSCGAAGDCFNFVMDYHKMDFPGALRLLAERAGIELTHRSSQQADQAQSTRAAMLDANALAERFFMQTLRSDAGQSARDELQRRGFTEQTIDAFRIGAAPNAWDGLLRHLHEHRQSPDNAVAAGLLKARDSGSGHYDSFRNRLIFPIHDELGRPIAFGGRRLDPKDDPKYLNSSESPIFDKSSTLFAIAQAKRGIIDTGCAIVTEGYTDVITCHQHGFTNVVATLGTALTAKHARILSRLCDTVVLLFDGDAAGQRAADRAIEVFFAGRLDVRICVLPDNLDPDDLLRKPDGAERFAQHIEDAQDALAYKIGRVRDELREMSTLSARQSRIDQVIADLARIGFGNVQGVRKAMVIQQIADILRVSADDISVSLEQATSQASRTSKGARRGSEQPRALDHTPDVGPRERAERALLGMICGEPNLLSHALDVPGTAEPTTVREFVRSFEFADGSCQQIVDSLIELHEAGNLSIATLLHSFDSDARAVATSIITSDVSAELSSSSSREADIQHACEALCNLAQRQAFEFEIAQLRDSESVSGEQLSELISQRRQQSFVGNRMPRVRMNRVD